MDYSWFPASRYKELRAPNVSLYVCVYVHVLSFVGVCGANMTNGPFFSEQSPSETSTI